MIGRLWNWLTTPIGQTRSYDIARPSRHLDNHFGLAGGGDADAMIEPALPMARNRCRHEVRNNAYARGVVDTLANDIVGTGPRLQLKTNKPGFNRRGSERWTRWGDSCDAAGRQDLADLLRLAILQFCESGEVFIHVFRDAKGPAGEESLRLLMIEPDRINTPFGYLINDKINQGIEMDVLGRPVRYFVQKVHPGSTTVGSASRLNEYDVVPAEQMIHLCRIDRPGQTRGMPWLTPALPLFAQLRQYTLSVATAAKTASDYAAVLESDLPIGSTPEETEEFETLDIERGSMMTLPAGWRLNQLKAEQPVNTYAMFKAEIINEIARCLSMPYNVAAGNSSSYNYASGRLDWQVYYRNIDVIRKWLARHLLNRVLALWMQESVLLDPEMTGAPAITDDQVDWYWPGAEHVDPAKEANAQDIHLRNLSTSYAAEYAKQGKDWELEFAQIARERERMQELGITPEAAIAPVETKDDDDEEENKKSAVRAA